MTEEAITKNLQSNFKSLRHNKSITQQKLADQVQTKRVNIGAYEEGRAKPSYSVLVNVAKFFNVSIDQLLLTKIDKK
jgi:transcriptional regulator with XRE-family HTH domain